MLQRAKFARSGDVLVDRSDTGHTIFHHVRAPSATEATAKAIRLLEVGDYRELAPLLSIATIEDVRPSLQTAANAAPHLHPNLAQALALVGGLEEVRILRRHVKEDRRACFAERSEEEQLRVLCCATALLGLRPSMFAVRTLVDGIRLGSRWTAQTAGQFVSDYLLTNPPLRLRSLLLNLLPVLLASEDECFVRAIPILLRRNYAQAVARCNRLFETGTDTTRRTLIGNLLNCPYYGLPLLLRAFEVEPRLDLRLSIAAAVAPALRSKDLSNLVRDALDDASPTNRLNGARLLESLEPKVSCELALRQDPEGMVEQELQRHRRTVLRKRSTRTRRSK